MFKLLSIVLAATSIGAGSAATAEARGCSCSRHTTAAPATAPAPAPATAQAQGGERTIRSFSYEPSMRSYSAPRTRQSQTPLYALPKTDARKFGGR